MLWSPKQNKEPPGLGLRSFKVFPTFNSGTPLPVKVVADHLLGILMLWQLAWVWLVQRQVLNLLPSLLAGHGRQPPLYILYEISCHANHKSYLKGIGSKPNFQKGDPSFGLALEVFMYVYVNIFLVCSKCTWILYMDSL